MQYADVLFSILIDFSGVNEVFPAPQAGFRKARTRFPRHSLIARIALPGAASGATPEIGERSEEHTSELQSRENLVCRLLLDKKKAYMCRSINMDRCLIMDAL